MTAPIDVMSIRNLGEYNSEIRGLAGKQVTLGDWASAIFILVLIFHFKLVHFIFQQCSNLNSQKRWIFSKI